MQDRARHVTSARHAAPRRFAPVLALLLATACTEPTAPLLGQEDCRLPRLTHTGTVDDLVLTAAGSPHLLSDSVVAGSVTVRPGALVCAAPGASLHAASVTALGTADLPVVFTAVDTIAGWAGIAITGRYAGMYGGPTSSFAHTVIAHADVGFQSQVGPVVFTDATVRRTRGSGIFAGRGHITDTRVEDACRDGDGCTAVLLGPYGRVELTRVTVEGSGGGGIGSHRRSSHMLRDVRILGSRNVGLWFPFDDGDFDAYRFEGSIRITGGAAHPASMRVGTAHKLFALPGVADSLSGNAHDVIAVDFGYSPNVALEIGPSLGWRVISRNWQSTTELTIEMEPGAVLELGGGRFTARLAAVGTAAAPVRITGPATLEFVGSDTSHISHARLEAIDLVGGDAHVLRLDDVEAERTRVTLRAPGSYLRNATLRLPYPAPAFPPPADSALVVLGPGTRVEDVIVEAAAAHGVLVRGDGVRIESCAVTGAAQDGIRVNASRAVVIRHCNLHDNAGFGLNNLGPDTVDARENWWGSAGGPGANGVNGAVLHTPFRLTPAAPRGG